MEYYKKAVQQDIKAANKKLVFGTVNANQPISRAGVKKLTRMSATTVSTLADELIAAGYLRESGLSDTKDVGRKGMLLCVNDSGGYFAGVDVKRDSIAVEVFDLGINRVKAVERKYSGTEGLKTVILSTLADLVGEYSPMLSVIIGVPAIIRTGRGLSSSVLDIAVDGSILTEIRRDFPNMYVELCNNSGLSGYAEKELNVGVSDLISIDIGEGVGSGIIIGDKIYGGKNGLAGEFGHMSVDMHGESCVCGGRGCIERLVCIPSILKRTQKSLEKSAELFKSGDRFVTDMLLETAKCLAYGINNLLNLLDAELVVLSGDIAVFGEKFLGMLRAEMKQIQLTERDVPVEYTSAKGNTVTLGGAYYAFDKIFNS